ncbi:MAG: hypothetical protein HN348_02350 [Proteobacteria bacterium]|nr:hypothetical protein [Pseudomonadota bacterium]
MARQSLEHPSKGQVCWLLIGLCSTLVLGSCKNNKEAPTAFDLPVAAAVLQPETGGPFAEPIGFVANGHHGQIVQLALKQGRFLTDDPTVSFLRTNHLPTGRARLLTSVAVWAPTPGYVQLFAGDQAFENLIQLPYIVDITDDGVPIEGELSLGDVSFTDADGSGDQASLVAMEVKLGYTSTETWKVTFDGDVWRTEGSRSGKLAATAETWIPYVGDERVVAFTVHGAATEGDYFEFATDNGLVERNVGGVPLALSTDPTQSRIAMVVHDENLDQPVLRWFDPLSGTATDQAGLAPDSKPHRLTWDEEGHLWVSDLGYGAVWEIDGTQVIEHPLPWPTLDVAVLQSDDIRRAFVVPKDGRSIWILDADTDELIDINTQQEGIQPMNTHSPILGIEAMAVPWEFPESDDHGVHRFERSIAVSLHSGRVVFMEEETGCFVLDTLGPRTLVENSFGATGDYQTNFESVSLPAFLEENSSNSRHVLASICGGITPDETWTLRHNRNLQAWEVEGTISGPQENLAHEDQRYVSDAGAINFVVRAGIMPSEDSWVIQFRMLEGILSADGDNDGDQIRDVALDVPGDPVYFHYRVGPTEGNWKLVDHRPFVLVLGQASNNVARIKPQTGIAEVQWD